MNYNFIELRKDIDELGETEARIKWKTKFAQSKYGQSYISLCCGKKDEIDKEYALLFGFMKEYEQKIKGCCGK